MDSGALLDLLGNENRRRILQLLARKPCYVTEISEYIGVSPKAVIDHLRRLEDAGLVESRVDDQRRKYFHIARNLRLEVNVSPYGFGMKSAYPASTNLDLTRCTYLSIEVEREHGDDGIADLADELDRLTQLERELSLAQRWVQGRVAETREALGDAIDDDANERLYADVLAAVAGGATTPDDVNERTDAPEPVVDGALEHLEDRGLVERDGDGYRVA
jgi:ArsR family transcriptional regulator